MSQHSVIGWDNHPITRACLRHIGSFIVHHTADSSLHEVQRNDWQEIMS